jgi:hypothetical protein
LNSSETPSLATTPGKRLVTLRTAATGTANDDASSLNYCAGASVTNVTPAEARPLTEVAEQVKQDWLARARRDVADARAKDIAGKAKSGDLAAFGKDMGLELKLSKPFTRTEGDGPIDPSLAQSLFALQIGEAATGRTGDGAIVARLTGIIPAKPEENKEQVTEVANQLTDTMRRDLYAEFLFALGRNIDVERNVDVIEQMIAAGQ